MTMISKYQNKFKHQLEERCIHALPKRSKLKMAAIQGGMSSRNWEQYKRKSSPTYSSSGPVPARTLSRKYLQFSQSQSYGLLPCSSLAAIFCTYWSSWTLFKDSSYCNKDMNDCCPVRSTQDKSKLDAVCVPKALFTTTANWESNGSRYFKQMTNLNFQ